MKGQNKATTVPCFLSLDNFLNDGFLLSWKLKKLFLKYFIYKLKFQTKPNYKIVFFQECKIMHRYICLQYSVDLKTKSYILNLYFSLLEKELICVIWDAISLFWHMMRTESKMQ